MNTARPIVRSSKLIHHRTVHLGRTVLEAAPVDAPAASGLASPRTRRKHRFVRSVAVAGIMSAAAAHAAAPDPSALADGLVELDPVTEVLDVAVAPNPYELSPVPTVGAQAAEAPTWLVKLEGVKANPYEAAKAPARATGKLIKKVPRARRVAWRHIEAEAPSKMSDLKSNPYE